MIKIKIKYLDDKFASLEIKGHSNSAPYGEDLICSAVSAVVTGGFNNLKDIDKLDIKLDEGHAYLKAKEEISSHDEIVIETIISGLRTIEENNPKFVKIEK